MTITLRPYEDHAALAVFERLDPLDHREAEITRGAAATPLALWADWRAMQPATVISLVACVDATPFAVIALGNTGQGGVAQAALLARDHVRFRPQLRRLAAMIRTDIWHECYRRRIHRIEARCWAGHPSAARLLSLLGFAHECRMPGFGLGQHDFHQFAWTLPLPSAPAPQPTKGQ